MADESYLRGLTDTLKAQAEESREQTGTADLEAEIVKLEAPKKWIDLKGWLIESVGQINRGLDRETIF